MGKAARWGKLCTTLVLLSAATYGLPPDLDHSDRVDGTDLLRFSRAWNTTPRDAAWKSEADLDFSGLVDENDYEILAKYFGMVGRVRRVWILDQSTSAIKRLADDGTLLAGFGGFSYPQTVAVNPHDGSLWLADQSNQRIVHLDKNGGVLARITGFANPQGTAVNPNNGDCWVADRDNDRAVLLSATVPDGYDVNSGSGHHRIVSGFDNPSAVAVNQSDGTCWVADYYNNEVVRLSADGSRELVRRGGFLRPTALAVNSEDGSCWVADTDNSQIVKLAVTGTELARVGGFNRPRGICVNSRDGSCFVADTGAGEVVKLDRNGAIVFRMGGFQSPLGPFADPATGCFWIADTNNHEVVKLSPNGAELLRISGFSYPRGGALDQGETGTFQPPTAFALATPQQGDDPLRVYFGCLSGDPDGSILRYQWDFEGDGLFDYSSPTSGTAAHNYTQPGIYNPILRVVDDQGLTALDSSIIIRVGRLTAEAAADPSSGYAPLTVNFTGTFFDPIDGRVANFQWDFDGDGFFEYYSETNPNTSHRYAQRGVYRAIFKVTDEGGVTAQDAVLIQVLPTGPVATAGANPVYGGAPLTVNFTGSGNDPDGFVVLYQWDFDGDTFFDWSSASNGNATHLYEQRRTYRPIFMVTDSLGLSAITSLTISVANSPPVVRAQALPTEGVAPLDVVLTGSASDPNGSIVLYEWAFEGAAGAFSWSSPTTCTVTHTYAASGVFSPTLRVTDDEGSQSMSTVRVVAKPAGTPVAHAFATPQIGLVPLTVNFDGTGEDTSGTIVLYRWDFGDVTQTFPLNSSGYPTTQLFVGPWPAAGYRDVSSSCPAVILANPSEGDTFEGRACFRVNDSDGNFNWQDIFGLVENAHAYSQIYLNSPTTQTVRIKYGVDDSARFWINGNLVESRSRGGGVTVDQFSFDTPLRAGWNKVLASVTNGEGRWGLAYRFTNTSGYALQLSYAISEPRLSGVTYESTSTAQTQHTYYGFGEHTAMLTVVDNDGLSDQDSVGITVLGRPRAMIRSPRSGYSYPRDSVAFVGEGSDPDGTIVLYEWDFDGDGTCDYSSQVSGSAFWSNSHIGSYTAVFRVTDDDLLQTTASVVVRLVGQAPTVTAEADPDEGGVPLAVMLNGQASDEDGRIVEYAWDFESDGAYDWINRGAPGSVVRYTSQYNDSTGAARNLLDGRVGDQNSWVSVYYPAFPQEIVFALKGDTPQMIDRVVLNSNSGGSWWSAPAKDFEILVSTTSPDAGFSHWMTAEAADSPEDQAFTSAPIAARYVKLRILSGWYWAYNLALAEFEVYAGGQNVLSLTPRVTHTYGTVGEYLATLRVRDADDLAATGTVRISVNVAGAPIASVDGISPNPGYVSGEVMFYGSGTDADGQVVKYEWDFEGDGAYDWMEDGVVRPQSVTPRNIPPGLQPPGNASYSPASGTFTVHAAGTDIWNRADEFYFLCAPAEGDFELRSTVEITTAPNIWAKAGLMVRANLSAGSPQAMIIMRTDDIVVAQERPTAGAVSQRFGGLTQEQTQFVQTGPARLRLTRSGPYVTVGFDDLDGNERLWWLQAYCPNLPDRCLVGLVLTSHTSGTLAEAKFSSTVLSPLQGNAAHVYDTMGTYRPTLRVTDNDGLTDTDSRELSIEPNILNDGAVWVADTYNGQIVKLSLGGSELLRLSGYSSPRDVSVNRFTHEVWIADSGNDQVVKVSRAGQELLRLSGFSSPQGVAANPTDYSCWVADTYNNTVVKLSASGARLATVSGFYYPLDVSVNPGDGACWVAEQYGGQVIKLNADVPDGYNIDTSSTHHTAAGGFYYPQSVAVNPSDGTCYVADYYHYQVVRLSADCRSELWRVGGFSGPVGVAVNRRDGTCWVADSSGDQVVKLSSSGSELARRGGFNYPATLAVNRSDGTCWVTDYYQSAAVKLSPAGYEIVRTGGFYYPWGIDIDPPTQTSGPGAVATASPLTGTVPLIVLLSGSCPNATSASLVRYEWDFEGDGAFDYQSPTTATVTHVYSTAGKYTPVFRVIDALGRVGYDYHLLVRVGQLTAFASANLTEGNAPLSVQFTHSGYDPLGRITLYQWDFDGNGTFDYSNGYAGATWHTYNRAGTYTAFLGVTNERGETAYDYVTVTVYPALPVAVAYANPDSGEAPLSVGFDGSSSYDYDGTIVLYQWDFDGDGVYDWYSQTTGDVGFGYARAGTYHPVLKVTDNDGQSDTQALTLTVTTASPTVVAEAEPREGNSPLTVRLSGICSDPDGHIVLYEWDWDGNDVYDYSSPTTATVSHPYTASGNYRARLRATDNDGASQTDDVAIQVRPAGSPTATADAAPRSGKVPLRVDFRGTASDADGTVTLYRWDFGDTYQLNASGCPTTQIFLGTWPATGSTDVSSSRPEVIPANPSLGDVFENKTWFKYSSNSGVFDWTGVFGYQQNVYAYSLIYVNSPTTQTVRVKYGVDDSARFWVNQVLVEQNSRDGWLTIDEFSFDVPLRQGWNKVLASVSTSGYYWQLTYRFTDTSNNPLRLSYSIVEPYTEPPTYESNSSGHTQHAYRDPGVYNATLTVVDNDGKSDTDTVTITAYQGYPPRAIPRAYPTEGAAPLTVRFPANGDDLDGTIDYFQWDFTSDGSWDWTNYRPEEASYTYSAPGTYRATLRVVDDDGLSGEASVMIYVYRPGGFSVAAYAAPEEGEPPLTVLFFGRVADLNGFVRLFEWDFNGDGVFDWSSPADASTSHTFTETGFHRAVLRVTDSTSLTAVASVAVDVKPAGSPTAIIRATPTQGDATLDVVFTGSATDPDGQIVSLEWDFDGDGVYDRLTPMAGITTDTARYSYTSSGLYQATLRATDNSGLVDLARVTIDAGFSIRAYRGAETFDPTQGQTMDIITVLTAPTSLTIRVVDNGGQTMRTLINNAGRATGYHSDPWDGRNDAGEIVTAGVYFFVIDYVVNGQAFHYDLTNTANPNGLAPSVTYPPTFDPIEDRPFYAQYTVGNAFEATVYTLLSDPPPWGMPVYAVKTITMREPRKAGTYVDVWDGTDDQGNLVAPGWYSMGVWVWDLPPNALIVASRPIISDVSKEPDYFDPAINAYENPAQPLEIQYHLSKAAHVTLTIEDVQSNVYKTIRQDQSGSGVFSALWDGKNESGDLLYPGTYKIGFEAVDDSGNRSKKIYSQFKIFY